MGNRPEFEARLRHAMAFAQTLVGLGRAEAEAAARLEGYVRSEVVTPDVEAVTADLDPYRIRIFVDDDDVVVRATGG